MIRSYQPADAAPIMEIQRAYQRQFPNSAIIPAQLYSSPGFAHGENVFCALDEQGNLIGYAPLYPALVALPSSLPHTFWAEIKVSPEQNNAQKIKAALFEALLQRSRTLLAAAPPHPARLVFEYFLEEEPSITYVQSRGAVYSESVYEMDCELTAPPAAPAEIPGVQIRFWRMESAAEQTQYVSARNQVFPENPTTLADWLYFMSSPLWATGGTYAAFAGEELVGNASVYWDPAQNQVPSVLMGYTENIFVLPDWRGRGIARALILECQRYLFTHQITRAHLEVRAANQDALKLYSSLGYRTQSEKRFYALPLNLKD